MWLSRYQRITRIFRSETPSSLTCWRTRWSGTPRRWCLSTSRPTPNTLTSRWTRWGLQRLLTTLSWSRAHRDFCTEHSAAQQYQHYESVQQTHPSSLQCALLWRPVIEGPPFSLPLIPRQLHFSLLQSRTFTDNSLLLILLAFCDFKLQLVGITRCCFWILDRQLIHITSLVYITLRLINTDVTM